MRAADVAAMERPKKRLQDEKTGFSEFTQGKRRIGAKREEAKNGLGKQRCVQ